MVAYCEVWVFWGGARVYTQLPIDTPGAVHQARRDVVGLPISWLDRDANGAVLFCAMCATVQGVFFRGHTDAVPATDAAI